MKDQTKNCLLDKSCKGFPTTLWRTFWFKTTAKKDGKTEILHMFSPHFLQFFFQLSPNFPNDKTVLLPSPVGKCLQEHWEGQAFLLQRSLPVQECINQRRSLDRLQQMRFNQLHRFCVCDWQAICPVLNPVQALKNCKVGNIKHMGFRVQIKKRTTRIIHPASEASMLLTLRWKWLKVRKFWWNRARDKTENLPQSRSSSQHQASSKDHFPCLQLDAQRQVPLQEGVRGPRLSKALSLGAQGQYSRSTLTKWLPPPRKQTYSCLKDVQSLKLRTQPEPSFFHSETNCFNMSGHEVKLYSCFLAGWPPLTGWIKEVQQN